MRGNDFVFQDLATERMSLSFTELGKAAGWQVGGLSTVYNYGIEFSGHVPWYA